MHRLARFCDVLRAVVAETAAVLFSDCVTAALKDKTAILVTHQVEFLAEVDEILVMEGTRNIDENQLQLWSDSQATKESSEKEISVEAHLGLKALKAFFSGIRFSINVDSTPMGRIFTRVASDMSTLDFDLPTSILVSSIVTIDTFIIIAVMASVLWLVLFVAIPTVIVAKYVQGYCLSSAREFMRMNGTTKAPILNYAAETSQEAPAIIEDMRPPTSWPCGGRIELHDLKIRYCRNAPLVLKGITCTFKEGTRVGVVGRTEVGRLH
ncbi:hypothetical protein Q3G72_030282 [Acer saccharum]|nr:hypothetical protein Q3G72_030282 [Acer saccharum]